MKIADCDGMEPIDLVIKELGILLPNDSMTHKEKEELLVKRTKNNLQKLAIKDDDLLRMCASSMIAESILGKESEILCELLNKKARDFQFIQWKLEHTEGDVEKVLVEMAKIIEFDNANLFIMLSKVSKRNLLSGKAKHAADSRHQKSGIRDKKVQICSIWATGKYTSRSLCAEQECAALNISYDTARKALQNTPDPT